MSALDMALARLDNPKPTGRDRWRSRCPACGGSASALSVGVTADGAVLLKCFKGCGADEVVGAMGLQLADLFPQVERPGGGGARPRRRAMLSMRQAADLLEFECLLVSTAAFNLAHGHVLTPDDLERLATAGRRVQALVDEARA